MAVMQRLRTDKLRVEKFTVIKDYDKFLIQNKIHEDIVKRDMRIEVIEEITEEMKEEIREKVKQEMKEEIREKVKQEMKGEIREKVKQEVKGEAKEEIWEEALEEGEIRTKHQVIISAYLQGANHTFIATITQMPIEDVENIIGKYNEDKKKET